jgi:hypothetical protein
MQNEIEVLLFLRNNGGASLRSQVCEKVFKNHITSAELDKLLATVLTGFVTARKRKNKETWKLTQAGWTASANHIATTAQNAPPTQEEPASDGFARFKALARENPDCSVQRLLQLAGRHIPNCLDEGWEGPANWWENYPKSVYADDVELDADGQYPLRYPENPLTSKERELRPTTARGWFERALRMPGASLEPFLTPLPIYEVANCLRVTAKVGLKDAIDIFSRDKIKLAFKLAKVKELVSKTGTVRFGEEGVTECPN